MKRKNTIEIENEKVELNSLKEFNEFKKHYNKYDFMQIEQNNIWKASLKNTKPIIDPTQEPTNREIMEMLIEIKAIVMRHEEILMRHEEILMRHEEIFKRNNLK